MKQITKTTIEKSHSKWSNFKLTVVCLLAVIGFQTVFAALGIRTAVPGFVFIIMLVAGCFVSILSAILLWIFKR